MAAPRRRTRTVWVGNVPVGSEHPIVVQSMLTSDTMDTGACVRETVGLVEAGCQIVRITAPTVKDARNLESIRAELSRQGFDVPLVADIHFKPEAALEAAKWVEKVRINPGNYADSKKFAVREYTDEQYDAELQRIRERFSPLVELCKARRIAMRIGTNHGSLSDRIMNRFGDTPLGMVESAFEFTRIARDLGYHDLIFSMKASNPKVMIAAYRLLAHRMDLEGWDYPIHLGVTEAGDGEDGRIKSAVGIGTLLEEGIGDTVRVSLTEDSIHEIPVAQALRALVEPRSDHPAWQSAATPEIEPADAFRRDPFAFRRRLSRRMEVQNFGVGGEEPVRVAFTEPQRELPADGEYVAEICYEDARVAELDPRDEASLVQLRHSAEERLVTVKDSCDLPAIEAFRLLAARIPERHPILLKDQFHDRPAGDPLLSLLQSSIVLGSLLCDGIGDAVLVRSVANPRAAIRLSYNILQAAGARIFKTDYVACPSCGRTLFNLQETTARIREATSHLKGVKIAIMGCIVNGPGEMADADFGYVGGAPGKINLYVGKTPVRFNIPQGEAVDRLKDLIHEHGKWIEPPGKTDTQEVIPPGSDFAIRQPVVLD